MLQGAVSINKHFESDSEVTFDEMVGTSELAAHYHMDGWSTALLEQLRLTFQKYHATSIQFGMSVVKLIVSITESFISLGGIFLTELKRNEHLTRHLENRSYTGLTAFLKEEYRVVQFPRIIYIGLLYHRKCLTDSKEIENFSKYNLSAIRAHINSDSDTSLCESIVQILPITNICSAIQLGRHLSYSVMEAVLASFTERQTSLIYRLL